jgi:hypothetical protein
MAEQLESRSGERVRSDAQPMAKLSQQAARIGDA